MQMLEGVVPWTTVFVIFSEIRRIHTDYLR